MKKLIVGATLLVTMAVVYKRVAESKEVMKNKHNVVISGKKLDEILETIEF